MIRRNLLYGHSTKTTKGKTLRFKKGFPKLENEIQHFHIASYLVITPGTVSKLVVKGTKSNGVIKYLKKARFSVKEITLDLAESMNLIAKKSFPDASKVIDR